MCAHTASVQWANLYCRLATRCRPACSRTHLRIHKQNVQGVFRLIILLSVIHVLHTRTNLTALQRNGTGMKFNWLLKMMSCLTSKQLLVHSGFFHIFPTKISHCCGTSSTQWIYSVFEIYSQCCSHLFWQHSHHKATGRVSSLLQGHLGLSVWLPIWKWSWIKHPKGDSFISLSEEAVLGVLRTSQEVLLFLLWFY